MLYACVERFDVIGERENILGWNEEVNKAIGHALARQDFARLNRLDAKNFAKIFRFFVTSNL
jgi:hypothetical protein